MKCIFLAVAVDPVSILYKSTAGRYRPVRVADGPITARCRFIKNASWGEANYLTENIRIFLISAQRIMLLVLNRSASANVLSNKENKKTTTKKKKKKKKKNTHTKKKKKKHAKKTNIIPIVWYHNKVTSVLHQQLLTYAFTSHSI